MELSFSVCADDGLFFPSVVSGEWKKEKKAYRTEYGAEWKTQRRIKSPRADFAVRERQDRRKRTGKGVFFHE